MADDDVDVGSVFRRSLGCRARSVEIEVTVATDIARVFIPVLSQTATPLFLLFVYAGLSEVVGGLGIEKLNSLMPDIVSSAEKADIQPHVRDGYLMMYIYLPSGGFCVLNDELFRFRYD